MTVNTIVGLLNALDDNTVDEIIVKNGTYLVNTAASQQANSLWISTRFADRTRPVLVRAETTGGVTFDGGGASYFGGLTFNDGAHDQTWQGFKFANGRPTSTGVIVIGGYQGMAAPHHITLRDITILPSVFSDPASNQDHGIYFSWSSSPGPHDILVDGFNVDGSGGIESAIHFYHSDASNPNAYNVTIRRMNVTGTDVAVYLWDSTIHNILIEDSIITGARYYGIHYEYGTGITLRNVTTINSGAAGFYSSKGSNPPGVTFINCNFDQVISGIYGPAIGTDSLNNTHLGGPESIQESNRFRASTTSTLTSVRVYIVANGNTGYSNGTGGILRVRLQTDDGTSNHFPSGVTLATASRALGQNLSGQNSFPVFTFTIPAQVTAGQLYHLVWDNIDPSPSVNYSSLDGMYYTNSTPSQWQPLFSNVDFVQLIKIGSGQWSDLRPWDPISVTTPSTDIAYSNGIHQGMGYMEIWGRIEQGFVTADGTVRFRETFTVTGGNHSVSSVTVRLARSVGTSPLSIRLETGLGTEIETVIIPASTIGPTAAKPQNDNWLGKANWYTVNFISPHILSNNTTYNLVFSTSSGTEYWTMPIREGTSYGYAPSTYFSDGHAEINRGSSWVDVPTWGGAPSSEGDLQFYFK